MASGNQTWRDFRHSSRRYSEGGLPLFGRASPTVLLKLCAGEFLQAAGFGGAVLAAAQYPLTLQEQDAACGIAENRDLQ